MGAVKRKHRAKCPHHSCPYCVRTRLHGANKRILEAELEEKTYKSELFIDEEDEDEVEDDLFMGRDERAWLE